MEKRRQIKAGPEKGRKEQASGSASGMVVEGRPENGRRGKARGRRGRRGNAGDAPAATRRGPGFREGEGNEEGRRGPLRRKGGAGVGHRGPGRSGKSGLRARRRARPA